MLSGSRSLRSAWAWPRSRWGGERGERGRGWPASTRWPQPCLVVGGLLTLCIYRAAPQVGWMLPGLWSLIFGLGIFASCRVLPRLGFYVGSFYVLIGCSCLLWGQGEYALSPWLMGISFGGGQLLGATVLYWTLERTHVTTPSE